MSDPNEPCVFIDCYWYDPAECYTPYEDNNLPRSLINARCEQACRLLDAAVYGPDDYGNSRRAIIKGVGDMVQEFDGSLTFYYIDRKYKDGLDEESEDGERGADHAGAAPGPDP